MNRIDRLLRREEVQSYLGISKNQFWKYVREKPHFRTVKIGKHRLMREDALQEFVSKEEKDANPSAPTP